MTNYLHLSFLERMQLFQSMACDNDELLSFLEKNSVAAIPHIDEKCVIFSLEDHLDKSLKYVVDPRTKGKLGLYLMGVVLRGLKNQYSLQDIEGVQKLSSPKFYENVPGLLGPFGYLPGCNLAHPSPELRDAQLVKALFLKVDSTLEHMHLRKILHKDIKPGNIVYSADRLHLIDFSTSTNFTEDLMDRSNNFIFGTPGYIYLGVDRSKDYFALGVSFAKTLLPELELDKVNVQRLGSLDIFGFEMDVRQQLTKKYGFSFTEYFGDLMHRSPEYNLSSVQERLACTSLEEGVRASFTFNVGNTTFVEAPYIQPIDALSS